MDSFMFDPHNAGMRAGIPRPAVIPRLPGEELSMHQLELDWWDQEYFRATKQYPVFSRFYVETVECQHTNEVDVSTMGARYLERLCVDCGRNRKISHVQTLRPVFGY